jgi:hypothetical protein
MEIKSAYLDVLVRWVGLLLRPIDTDNIGINFITLG